MTPEDYLRMQAINQVGQARGNGLRQALPYAAIPAGAAALYGANALASGGGEDWLRTAENTVGNLAGGAAGAYAGSRFGLPGAVVGGIAGALGGGYVSDRIADQFDDNDGRVVDGNDLLNQHLGMQQNPYEQEAQLRQQLQQVQMAQRQQQAAMRQQAMQQYQGQQ